MLIGKAWGVSPPWCERCGMAKRNLVLQKCRMALSFAKWHAAPRSYTYAIPCNFTFSCNFLGLFDTQKDFLIKLGHFDMSISLIFRNHHLHHCFKKLIKSSFFKTREFMFQTSGILLWLIHFPKKKKNHHHHLLKKKSHWDFQKSCILFKLGAFAHGSFF